MLGAQVVFIDGEVAIEYRADGYVRVLASKDVVGERRASPFSSLSFVERRKMHSTHHSGDDPSVPSWYQVEEIRLMCFGEIREAVMDVLVALLNT